MLVDVATARVSCACVVWPPDWLRRVSIAQPLYVTQQSPRRESQQRIPEGHTARTRAKNQRSVVLVTIQKIDRLNQTDHSSTSPPSLPH
mmetsp:Transcript_5210/g.12265  ORF Transcript_5210/g.12265 Transcript_5210/m.12265 type:complete len:89 (-) Transcript_5210:636-902(-)